MTLLTEVYAASRNHARKAMVSTISVIKIGVLLGRSHAGRQVVGHEGVVSGANRHAAQRPGHVSRHAPWCRLGGDCGFGGIRSLGCGLERPTWLVRGGRRGYYRRIVAPPSEDPSCRQPVAACSPVELVDIAGSGADPSPGAGRRIAGSEESPNLASSLALRSPQLWLMCGGKLWKRLQWWCCGS